MTAIRVLAEIVLAVHDLERALAFYKGVLGLERIPAPEYDPELGMAHGITPESIQKGVSEIAEFLSLESPTVPGRRRRDGRKVEGMSPEELEKLVITLEEEMFTAAEELRFEYAAKLRDEIKDLRRELLAAAPS